jgi:hypothetical protein
MSDVTENENVAVSSEKETPKVVSAKKQPKRTGLWAVAVVLLLVVVGVGAKVFGVFPSKTDDAGVVGSTDPGTLVASVNGIPVTRGELDEKIEQVRGTFPEGSADPTADAGFELQLLDEVLNLKLLVATAEARGLTASDEQVEKEIQSLKDAFGGDEAFTQQLAQNNMTTEQLRENMHNELLIRQLVDNETTIKTVTVTDEEVKAEYTTAVNSAGPEGASTVPPFEQVQEMIKAQLTQKKSALIVQAYIETLRAGADIKILLK